MVWWWTRTDEWTNKGKGALHCLWGLVRCVPPCGAEESPLCGRQGESADRKVRNDWQAKKRHLIDGRTQPPGRVKPRRWDGWGAWTSYGADVWGGCRVRPWWGVGGGIMQHSLQSAERRGRKLQRGQLRRHVAARVGQKETQRGKAERERRGEVRSECSWTSGSCGDGRTRRRKCMSSRDEDERATWLLF